MRTFLLCLVMSLVSFGLVVNEASAKRFGGGRSFGVQRSASSFFKQNTTQSASAFTQKSGTGSKWGGFLGGALMGGLLASLFMGHGIANGILTWLIVGIVIFFAIGFFRRLMQPGMSSGYQSRQASPFQQNLNTFTNAYANSGSNENYEQFPPGFDPDRFLRNAKITFIRLQTAYDQKNLADLTQFTAPEVFGEIQMQLDERGDAPNTTVVSNLNAELLDVSVQANTMIASVHFTGRIKENDDPEFDLDEIWHFRQFEPNGDWVVGGIQQEIVNPR